MEQNFLSAAPHLVVIFEELREHFSQFGYVASSSVVFDKKTGMSKGFGFVAFGNRDGFIGATKQQQHVLEGSTLSVRPATSP
ncbi:SRA stem-loop-interacting RNA-binding protein, mitochondrial isoform X2 [Dermacentor silvarum]|uniref:SRA stem-loop-interacting RNA-binding protein, mitochondrial isoform X2 n=1 Tax=Dermacentor silvarum TaxID=543639 RepID=UPI002100AFD9|nr:SRA stem-loop-interacting RNA-binding protein, mitochondrial isoform X2 [Dermacentor silvarum]